MKRRFRFIAVCFMLTSALAISDIAVYQRPAYARTIVQRIGGGIRRGLKKGAHAVGFALEKTAQGTKKVVRGAVRVVRKVEKGRKNASKFLRKKLPGPLGPLACSAFNKGLRVLNPTAAVVMKAGGIVNRVDQVREGRRKARQFASNIKKYGDEFKKASRHVVQELRKAGVIKPKHELKVLQKTNKIKMKLDKVADNINKASKK